MTDQDVRGRAIVIAGPTASGKSAIAVAIAERLGGEVINADSMQVYADLAILTARPSAADLARVPHHLFGHIDAAEAYSVGRWLAEVRPVLHRLWGIGRVPVLVGGTGLYLKALMQGLSDLPTVPAEIRTHVRAAAAGRAPEDLHAELRAVDPDTAARLRPSDPQRIIRALEVHAATGLSLARLQQVRLPPVMPSAQVTGVAVSPERGALYARIDRRFDGMMDEGAMDEVARLAARNLDPALPAMRALGVAPLIGALKGESSVPDAVAQAKLLTRRYAKRQMTFTRHQLTELAEVEPELVLDRVTSDWRG